METVTVTPLQRLAVACGFAALAIAVFLKAWVCEDAYITFRVLDNFMNGYGLRWNIGERVQVYTHPLWMLLHIPLLMIWKNIFLVSIGLGVACTIGALTVTLSTRDRPALVAIACFLLPLFLSASFMHYTTSGLENPLSYLLFACFGFVLVRMHEHRHFWFWCSLSVALALFNRLDTIILYAPVLFYLMRRKPVAWGQALLGAVPLIAWFYFALLYYGFIFPNTKYAKLGTDLDLMLYLTQGLRYAKYLLIWDTAGALILASSLLFVLRPRWFAAMTPAGLPRLPAMIAGGVALYSLYVVYIGGDYMAGRFWALPIFATLWMWYAFCPPRLRFDVAFLIACLLGTAAMLPPQFDAIRQSCSECIPLQGRILNAFYTFRSNGLVTKALPLKIRYQGRYVFAENGRKLAREKTPVKQMWYIGMVGFYAGPKITIIDELGLADPLLARLPAVKRQNFYIGHFRRNIPKGYKEFLETGDMKAMPPLLARYYEKLHLITSGPLLDRERLKTVLLFNLGVYDHWKMEYLKSEQRKPKRK